MKKAIGLALVALMTSVVAASAQGAHKVATRTVAGFNCSKTITLPLVTPVTGGAGFLGAEQGSWAKYVADKSGLVLLGPSTSGAVAASSSTYYQAKIAHISPSATRTSLTQGANKEATPAFFRVVPGDYIQGPTDATYMIKNLKVKKV